MKVKKRSKEQLITLHDQRVKKPWKSLLAVSVTGGLTVVYLSGLFCAP
jgi:hypothetical protein